MRIAFFGQKRFSDYYQIGGFESLIRRLALYLSNKGNRVEYLIYENWDEKEIYIFPNLKLKYFINFEDAINEIKSQQYDHILPVKLKIKDRIKYIKFIRGKSEINSHYLALVYPGCLKRKLIAVEGNLFAKNGKIFCFSPRIYEFFRKYSMKASFLIPPVPEEYFLSSEKKPKNEGIKITYLGNLTPDKYIEEVIKLFIYLNKSHRFETTIYGTFDPLNLASLNVHKKLMSQKEIKYIYINRDKYSSEVEGVVRKILMENDVLVQPYRTLINTLDTPLLLLEAMASLCVVVTTRIGNIRDIYGESSFILSKDNFLGEAKILLEKLDYEMIQKERERIWKRNQLLQFDLDSIGKRFIEALL